MVARLHRRGFVLASAAGLTALHLPRSAAAGIFPTRSGLPWASGVFDQDPNGFAAWRGRPLDALLLYSPRKTWAEIRTRTGPALSYRLTGRQETMVISYPLFPDNHNPKTHGGDLWRRAALGELDAHHVGAADSLKGYSPQLVLRPGWEWNNKTFGWSCLDVAHAENYRTYFRRIVDIFRARLPGILIDWSCDKESKTNAGMERWYPGGAYVDMLGCNKYDFWPALTTQAAWDRDYGAKTKLGDPKGIGAWLAYAKGKGKPLTVGEWGLIDTARNGGGDNPFFITRMLGFFQANAASVGYETYFNKNTTSFRHRLQDNPKAGAAYRQFLAAA